MLCPHAERIARAVARRYGRTWDERQEFTQLGRIAIWLARYDAAKSSPESWAYIQADGVIRNHLVKQLRRARLFEAMGLKPSLVWYDRRPESNRDDRFLDLLSRLTPRQQEAIIHLYCDDLSLHETARRMGLDPAAVSRLQARALTTLRAQLT